MVCGGVVTFGAVLVAVPPELVLGEGFWLEKEPLGLEKLRLPLE